uniref:Uncharacterized protein n=1 Tax=Rhipicephalus appendiculatus TaxID=34631 RepID=A0A131YDJ4_RHIAP
MRTAVAGKRNRCGGTTLDNIYHIDVNRQIKIPFWASACQDQDIIMRHSVVEDSGFILNRMGFSNTHLNLSRWAFLHFGLIEMRPQCVRIEPAPSSLEVQRLSH